MSYLSHLLVEDGQNFPGIFIQFLFIEKGKKSCLSQSLYLSVQCVHCVCTVCTVCLSDHNPGLTQLMYITELMNP